MSIGDVGEQDLDEVQMEEGGRDDTKEDVAHPEEVQVAVQDQPCDTGVQNDCPRNSDGDIELSQGVKVDDRTPVTTLGADVDHFDDAGVVPLRFDVVVLDRRAVPRNLEGGQVSQGDLWDDGKRSKRGTATPLPCSVPKPGSKMSIVAFLDWRMIGPDV